MFSSLKPDWLRCASKALSSQLNRHTAHARRRFRQRLLEQLEPRLVMDSQWQNPARPLDVNNNGSVAPLDALLLINKLNLGGSTQLPPRTNPLDYYYDPSGDGILTPRDALLIINELNVNGSSTDPRQPGESETGPAGFISLPLTTLAGAAGQVVRLKADMTIGRVEFNEMGVFVVDDAAGNIGGVVPTSIDYPRMAFDVAQRRVLFSRRDEFKLSTTVDLPAGQHLRVYVLQGVTSDGDIAKHLRLFNYPNGVLRVGWEEHAPVVTVPFVTERNFDDVFVDMHFDSPISTNSAPVLTSVPDKTIPELTNVTFDATAFDADLPADVIRYSLDNAPPGASINPTTGVFSWTPTEAQGPGSFTVVVRATDSTGAFDTESVRIEVLEVNLAPVLAPIADVDLRPGDQWVASASASDPDLPANQLTYSLGSGAPAGLTIDSRTGAMRFTAPSTDRQSVYPVTVTVRDNGSPALSASRSFTIRVTAQRTAPVIEPILDQSTPEMTEKVIRITARDLDLPDDILQYSLISGPVGATLNSSSGTLRWTPTEAQGPGVFPVTVRAIDRDGRSDTKSFTITVTEVNRPPVLEPIGSFNLSQGESISFAARASDPDLPLNTLTYSISGNAPPGFSFNTATGQFNWNSSSITEPTQFDFLVRVTDNGVPALSAVQSVTINVALPILNLVEDDRFVTQAVLPVTIGSGITALAISYDELTFDRQDPDSINDAFEVALVDGSDRPLVGIITPNRDGYYNRTEELTTLFGSGTTFTSDADGNGGTIRVDVSHLPAGAQANLVVRLVNNDADNTTRVKIVPRVMQIPGVASAASLATPPAWASSLDVLSRTYTDTDWRHLADVTSAILTTYDYTAYDIDSERIGAGVTLRNTSMYPIRGPFLVTVSGISSSAARLVNTAGQLPRDPGRFSDATIARLAGSEFLDATRALDHDELGGVLLPGESVRLLLEFENTSLVRFDYQVHALGTLNRAPQFTTEAPTSVRLGNTYRYDSGAVDPDSDTLIYSLVSGPAGLAIDAASGMVTWTPTASDLGSHNVVLHTVDPFGASDTQPFTIDVVTATSLNRPPVFVTDPILEASVGITYQYPSRAADPDFDALTYSLVSGPAGMSILAGPSNNNDSADTAGNVTWTPPASAAGTYVSVTLRADDNRSGEALQNYRIYVRPNPLNLPPVIVTTPQFDFDWAGPLGVSTGVVNPPVIELDLGVDESAKPLVTVKVPPQLPMVDVFLLFDDTGSFSSTAPQLATAFPQVITNLQRNLPNVDLGFGVGRFEDYGGVGDWAESFDRPFVLNQPILPASMTQMRDAIIAALSRTAPGDGGDGPETLIEGLYQVATGAGFDGNGDGSSLESGPAGSITTQIEPGASGDVPPFLPSNFDAYRSAAIPLPLDVALNVPVLTNASTFAFKFNVTPGNAFQFLDSASSTDQSQWLVVNQSGQVLGTHRRGRPFIESFEVAEEILLVPRVFSGSSSAATLRRVNYQVTTNALSFGQDIQFAFAADGDRHRFTFSLTEATPVIFDGIAAEATTSWRLSDGAGQVFSTRMFSQTAYGDTGIELDPSHPSSNTGIVDQVHVLAPGNYVLTFIGKASSTQTLFNATKQLPTSSIAAGINATTSVPLTKERIQWVRVDGQTGQGISASVSPRFILDADGQQQERITSTSFQQNQFPQLTFGSKPTFWLGYSANENTNLSLTINENQPAAALPSAIPIVVGAVTNGQVTNAVRRRDFELTLNSWQWVTVAANQGLMSWRMQTAGGAQWYEQAFFSGGKIPFLNEAILLPPGAHRLTVSAPDISLGGTSDFQFTVSTAPHVTNPHVTDGNPNDFVLQGPGTRGGAGFRPGAIPIILAATDTGTAFQPGPADIDDIIGIDGLEIPITDFTDASRAKTTFDQGATIQQAINALLGQGALVIGLGTDSDPGSAPRRTLEAISKLTGATNASQDEIKNNIDGDPILPGEPLYFLINGQATALADGVTAAIEAAIKAAPTNVNLVATDHAAGFTNVSGEQSGIRPDSTVEFKTLFVGDGQAHVFDLQFVRPGSSEIIGSIPVAINDRYRYDSKAIDPDNDPVTLELVGENHGATFDARTGKIRWRPAAPGSYTFTLRASDPYGGEDLQTWTVNVGDLRTQNSPPTLSPFAPVVITANTALRVEASASDTDRGDQLRYVLLGSLVGGNVIPQGLTIDSATGRIDWTPSLAQVGLTTVTVRVTDAHGGVDDETLTIEVVPPAANDNRMPSIISRAVRNAVAERAYTYDVHAVDFDFDPLLYSLVNGPRGMVVDADTGVVAWNPQLDDLGAHDVLLKVSDGRGGVSFQGYELLVSQTNDPPEIASRPEGGAAPGTAWNYQVTAVDPNGDVLRYALVGGQNPSGATINATTGSLTWTPAATGAYRFLIEVSDGRGGRARQEFILPVSDAVPPRIISTPTGPARVGERYEYLVVAMDANAGDTVTLSLDDHSLARGATLTATGCPADQSGCAAAARLVWHPNSIGEFPIEIKATDAVGNTATQSFTLKVVQPAAASRPPIITSQPMGPALKNTPWTYAVSATDPDGDTITYRLGQAPAGMAINATTGLVNWTPSSISAGVIVEVVAEDARGAWSMQAFDLPVVERLTNAAPIITSIPTGPALVNEPWNYQASAFDPDGDVVSYTLDAAALAAGLVIDSRTGQISWTPRAVGQQVITLSAQDAYGGMAIQTITLPIEAPPNLPPAFISVPTGPALVGQAWSYAARAIDPEGNTLSYALGGTPPTGASIEPTTGRLTFTPTSAGSVEFTVIATDSAGNRAQQQFTLPVVLPPSDSTNRPPVFVSTPIGPARVGREWLYMAQALDADNDVVTYSLNAAALAAGLTIETTTGRIRWTPAAIGTQPIEVSARDAVGNITTQRFDLPIVRDNRAPIIESEPTGPVLRGRAWTYTLVTSDPDGDDVTLSLDAASLALGMSLVGKQLSWTPTATGTTTTTITASDNRGGASTQVIKLSVGEAGAPSAGAPRFRSLPPKEATLAQTLNYKADAFDPDGTSITYTLARGAVGMSLNSQTGELSWRPEQLVQVAVEITATDQAGERATQAFTLTVVAGSTGNQPPVITSQPRGPAVRHLPYQYPVQASDPNGDALTYSLDAASLARGMTISATGLLQWLPTIADQYSITVTVRDALGAATEQSFTLPVISNAPPQITSTAPTRVDLGQTLSYTVIASDPNPGDTLTYSADGVTGLVMNAQSGLLTWQPTAPGRYTFTVYATDNHQARDEQVIDLMVVDPNNNQPPKIEGAPRAQIQFGVEYLWQVPATDADGDSLNYELMAGPTGLTVDARGLLRWTPTAAQVTSGDNLHTIVVRVSDGRGGQDEKTWRMAVGHSAGNQAPSIVKVQVRAVDYTLGGDVPAVLQHAVAGRVYQALFSATDPEGDTLVWSLVDAPNGMRIDARGLVDYRPTTSHVGTHNVRVRVTDTAGASGVFSFALTVRAGNSPAKIAGNPPVHHKVETLYSTTFSATDVDGDVVAFRFVAGQPSHGAQLDASTGKLTWTPASTGTYRFFVAAVDPLGEGTQLVFDVLVDQFGPNDPPKFEDTQPGVAEVGLRYSRRYPAIDPNGDTLTYAIEEGPAGLAISASDGTVTWDAPAGLVGTSPLVKLTAKDPAGQTARYQFRLPVRAANTAPRFDSTPSLAITAGNVYRYDVAASDADGDTLTLALLSGPTGLTLDAATGRIAWTTATANIGAHNVKVSLTDGRIAQPLEQTWTITVSADTARPQVKLLASATVIDIGSEVSFEVRASDNVAVSERTLKVGDINIALSSSGFGRYTFTTAGRFDAVATARDAAGNVSTDQMNILVRDPNNAAPQVLIVSPTAGQQLTAPTDVLLSASDAERDLTAVRLLFAPTDGSADFRQFAALTAAAGQKLENFTNKVIGQFDPTNLVNGSYIIRAVAEDAGFNQTLRETTVQVAGRLKLGNFAVSFDDLTIPVSGMPITIVRSYDTLDVDQPGDFGNGWKLDIKQARVRIDAATLGGVGSGRYRAFVNGTRVFVKTPEGTEEGFTFRAIPDQTLFGIVLSWKSNFDPDRGNNHKLEAPAGDLKQLGDEFLSGYGTTFNPQDPEFGNAFQVTSIASRITYNVNATTGETSSIEDRNKNKLELRYDGIISSAGRSVTFQRDMQGRIVSITDPRGNSLRYGYDAAGDLVSFTDRMGNMVRMTYHTEPAHYLDTVIDPLGNVALKASYKLDNYGGNDGGEGGSAASGRLSRLEDATGSYTAFDNNPQELRQTQRDEKGIVSTVQYDGHGNLLEIVERGGNRMQRTFEDPVRGLPTTETQVIGQLDSSSGERDDITVRRTYNQWGQVTSETDSRGNVTRYMYNSQGVPTSTINPDGSSTNYSFDDKFNLTYTSSSSGGATSMSYDTAGQVTEVRSGDFSASGNVIKLKYNRFGEVIETQDTEQNNRSINFDANGNNVGTEFTWTDPNNANNKVTLKTSSVVAPNDQPQSSTSTSGTSRVEFDTLNRSFRSIDENGLVSETRYDLRGLAIETRTQSLNENGATVWLASRMLYNQDGEAIYSTYSLPEGTAVADIVGTHNIFDDAGRVVRTERRLGIDIQITGTPGKLSARLNSAGRLITTSETQYDSSGRVWQTIDNYGRKSQTLFDRFGQTIESRTQSYDESGALVWLTSRSVYDSLGRSLLSTDRYVMPASTELGAGASPAFYATATLYDNQGRSIGSQRISGAVVTITGTAGNQTSAITARGTQLHESKNIYDTRSRVSRSISPTGQIIDFVYDARDRQIATISHPLPAEESGLGSRYPGKMVRLRSETEFNSYGQVAIQRTNVIQVEESDGRLVTIDRRDARETQMRYDAEGRLVNTIAADGNSVRSEYDSQGRVVAEINQLGLRRTFEYDTSGRLTAVVLPEVTDPATGRATQPRYEYGYNAQGNQTLLRDPLGRETRFGFDSLGRQVSRTLPIGFGLDGILGTSDDAAVASGDWTERTTYDERSRVETQVSFEGVVTRFIYDDTVVGGGHLSQQRFYPNVNAYQTAPNSPAETWAFEYDAFGREVSVTVTGAQPRRVSSHYDTLGQLVLMNTPEGAIEYQYDDFARKTATRVGKSIATGQPLSSFVAERATEYAYDPLSRLSKVTEVVYAISGQQRDEHRYFYDLLGSLDAELVSNGLYKDYVYDNMQRLRQLTHYRTDGTPADIAELSDDPRVARFDYTVRADGRRTAADELWYTVGSATQSSPLQASYQFTYDNLGRLTDEVFDHWDNSLDYRDRFAYDPAGNRIEKSRDAGRDGSIDARTAYRFDVNDRLIDELAYGRSSDPESRTTYTYDHTQNTGYHSERFVNGSQSARPTLTHVYTYDLQGRLFTATVTSYNDAGTASSITRSTYDYDDTGIRVSAVNEVDSTADGTFETRTKIEYLVDHHNHTGYQQAIRESHHDVATGKLVETVDYTFGHDEISQTVVTYNSAGTEVSRGKQWFLHDGKANVRGLLDAASAMLSIAGIEQIYFYEAYGSLLNLQASQAATTLLYNGEQFDVLTGNQYLRARYYNPLNAQFNRLDPFFGNHQDPQSFNKYGYVHGDPIGSRDPLGLMTIGSTLGGIGIGNSMRGTSAGAITGAGAYANTALRIYDAATTAVAAFQGYLTGGPLGAIAAIVGLDPSELSTMTKAFKDKGITPATLISTITSGTANAAGALPAFYFDIDVPRRGKLGRVFRQVSRMLGKSNDAQEFFGEIGAGLLMHVLGFHSADLPVFPSVKGPDFMLRQGKSSVWAMVEAKGGTSRLSKGADYGDQMQWDWIRYWYHWLAFKNQGYGAYVSDADGKDLWDHWGQKRFARDSGSAKPIAAAVVSLDLNRRKDQLKIGIQAWTNNEVQWDKWKGF